MQGERCLRLVRASKKTPAPLSCNSRIQPFVRRPPLDRILPLPLTCFNRPCRFFSDNMNFTKTAVTSVLSNHECGAQSNVAIDVRHGLPHLTVPLPSRNERCVFVLRPVTHTVGELLEMLRTEDAGIDRAVIRNEEGVRIASTTSIQNLLEHKFFDLCINEHSYRVDQHSLEGVRVDGTTGLPPLEELKHVGHVNGMVSQLYEALHIRDHQLKQERELLKELEALQDDFAPLEEQRSWLAEQAEKGASRWCYGGLFAMCFQAGMLGRLTWWEYSWDIMEPVTYFVTCGNAIACFAYFVLTKQDCLLPDVRDRQYLLSFHKLANQSNWDVEKYNSLCEEIVKAENSLQRLRDPLKLRLSEASRRDVADVKMSNQTNNGTL